MKNIKIITNIYNLSDIFIKSTIWYLFLILRSNFLLILWFYQFTTLSYLNNNKNVKNVYKLIAMVKIFRFNSLFEVIFIWIKTINRP